MADIILKKGEENRLLAGHLWVYGNEVSEIRGEALPGAAADVYSASSRFIGRGLMNPASKILVRLLTREKEPLDRGFWKRRLTAAIDYRKRLDCLSLCRLVFSDADLLPGLVVDKFGDVLVMQLSTLAMDLQRETLTELLWELLSPRCIYERSDMKSRRKEGLVEQKGVLKGVLGEELIITENGFRLLVDVEQGQKTGYFLDQRENRAAIAPYVTGGSVLDCFCHTGGFAVHAAGYGALSVQAVDVSEHALAYASRNAQLNGFTNLDCVQADVFSLLTEYRNAGKQFDTVILDPPAFCKNRSALEGAYRGYREINYKGMGLVHPGGYLITCSCSHYMLPELFRRMLAEAAADAGRPVRLVEFRSQAKDHPELLGSEESGYLKCCILQVF